MHLGRELFQVDSQISDAVLKQLWHHTDATMCCSVQMNISELLVLFCCIHFTVIDNVISVLGSCSFHICKPGRPWHARNYSVSPWRYNTREDSGWSILHHCTKINLLVLGFVEPNFKYIFFLAANQNHVCVMRVLWEICLCTRSF